MEGIKRQRIKGLKKGCSTAIKKAVNELINPKRGTIREQSKKINYFRKINQTKMNGTLLFIGNLGGGEWLIILLAIVFLFGGKKIPELMRGIGTGVREFNDAKKNVKDQIEEGMKKKDEDKDREDLKKKEEELKRREEELKKREEEKAS